MKGTLSAQNCVKRPINQEVRESLLGCKKAAFYLEEGFPVKTVKTSQPLGYTGGRMLFLPLLASFAPF